MEPATKPGKSDIEVSQSAPRTKYVPQGNEELIADFSVYVNWPEAATKAIIFASDVHGWENPNLRKIADKAAAAGFLGLVPDYFYGDPFVARPGVGDERYFPWVDEWIEKHRAADLVDASSRLMKELKNRGITSFGLSGFCWGAMLAMELDPVEDFKAIVLLHPSKVNVEFFQSVRPPIAILAAEFDNNTPVETIQKYAAALNLREVPSFVKVYKGTHHGWTIKDLEGEESEKAAEESHQDMLDWYIKYL